MQIFRRLQSLFIQIKNSFDSVFRSQHLLTGFIARDIKGRFAGSIGGISWALINPVLSLVVYYYIFSMVLRVQVTKAETGTDSFFIFFLTGFFPWTIFSESLSKSIGILVDNSNLITKVVFPVELLHAGCIFSTFLIHAGGLLIFLLFLVFNGAFHFVWISLILVFFLQILFTWGLSFLLSSLCVFFRDIKEIFGLALMVWFYATPIVYPAKMVPESLEFLPALNPLAIFVELYRQIILVHQIPLDLLFQSATVSIISYVLGYAFFIKTKPAFGDVL